MSGNGDFFCQCVVGFIGRTCEVEGTYTYVRKGIFVPTGTLANEINPPKMVNSNLQSPGLQGCLSVPVVVVRVFTQRKLQISVNATSGGLILQEERTSCTRLVLLQ